MISSPLHLLDCCIISDGGGALVITSAERARDLKKKPAYILGCGETVRHAARGQRDFLEMAAAQSGPLAFERAGRHAQGHRHGDDLRLVHDHGPGDAREPRASASAARAARSSAAGGSRFDGAFPINTDGGGLSSNHPGMRGMFLVIEAVKQLRGECGPRQVKDCEIALAHGTGGTLGTRHSGATLILSNQ